MDNNKVKENVSRILMKEVGMTYDEYERLDIYDQQEIIKKIREKKNKTIRDDQELVMIGYGEYSTVTKVKKGTKVMVRYGNVVEAGLTPEEEQKRLNEKIDKIIEEKPKNKILGIFRRKV